MFKVTAMCSHTNINKLMSKAFYSSPDIAVDTLKLSISSLTSMNLQSTRLIWLSEETAQKIKPLKSHSVCRYKDKTEWLLVRCCTLTIFLLLVKGTRPAMSVLILQLSIHIPVSDFDFYLFNNHLLLFSGNGTTWCWCICFSFVWYGAEEWE